MITFFLKKIFKSFGNICVLLSIVIIPLFCLIVSNKIDIPSVGYIVDDDALKSNEVNNIISELEKENYVKYVDREKMLLDIDDSIIDAGIVIKNDFVEKLKNNETDGIIEFLTSDSSLFSDMRKIEVLSKFMTVYAPYITYDTIGRIAKGMYEEEYSLDKIKTAYNNLYNEDTSVIIDIEKVDGQKSILNSKSEIYFIVALVFLVFITIVFFVVVDSINFANKMKERFSRGEIFKKIFLPLFILKTLVLCVVVSLVFILKPIVEAYLLYK